MNEKIFKHWSTIFNLVSGMLYLLLGVILLNFTENRAWLGILILLMGLISTISFFHFEKHGYIKISNDKIRINNGIFRGIMQVKLQEIQSINFKEKYYTLLLANNKTAKIYKHAMGKHTRHEFDHFMKSNFKSKSDLT